MLEYISRNDLGQFAYTNCDIVKKPVCGICVDFFGMNFVGWVPEHTEIGKALADEGIAYFQPYLNPWAWGNRQAIEITDRIVDEIIGLFDLPADVPVVSCGGSMGGYTSIVYSIESKHNIVACQPNAAATDLPDFMEVRAGGTPRVLFNAFYSLGGKFEDVLAERSPINMIDKLPDIPYRLFHSDGDGLVPVDQSIRFVEKAKATREAEIYISHNDIHGDFDPEMRKVYIRLIVKSVKG